MACGTAGALSRATRLFRNHDEVLVAKGCWRSVASDCLCLNCLEDVRFACSGSWASAKKA